MEEASSEAEAEFGDRGEYPGLCCIFHEALGVSTRIVRYVLYGPM